MTTKQTSNQTSLNQKYLYLWINILSLVIPLLFSFYPKANFSKKWKYVLPAIAVSALFFMIWDFCFTRLGVWGVNPKYITGIYLINLPLEEVLFFFCIPYACLFTYFALNHLIEEDHLFPHQELISSVLIFLLLILGGYYMQNLYTGVTFLLTGLFLALIMLKLRTRFMGRFYFAFIFILFPFLVVTGILTGSFIEEPIVWYNSKEILGIRLGTIPVEDVFYGMLLVLIPITLWEKTEEWLYYKK